MNLFLAVLTIINFLGLVYLIFLFYKKNNPTIKNIISSSPPINSNIKINLSRFNPFEELGGDQSFILCLLDNNNTGAIITSLHNRDFTRIYAKAIKNSQSIDSILSKEEKAILDKTIKNSAPVKK